MTAYYNEHDPKKAAWLRELIAAGVIAPGIVDERSIEDVLPSELVQFTQCHFFAGIGIWSYALRQAGWPDDRPVWTGSCPCQPFSTAGKREGLADQRHLWPTWNKLIGEAKPPIIFGEQVASSEVVGSRLEVDFAIAVRQRDFARANKLAKRLVRSSSFHYWPRWISIVQGDLGTQGYTMRLGVLGAHSVGAPHIRQRLYFVGILGDAEVSAGCVPVRERQSRQDMLELGRTGPTNGFWRDAEWIYCRDGKWRPTQPGISPLVNGAAERLVRSGNPSAPLDADNTAEARTLRLRGYGDGIVAPLAVEFIRAAMEWGA